MLLPLVLWDFGISEGCLHRWLKIADRDDGVERGTAAKAGLDESAELREARKRIKLLKQGAEVMRRAVAYLSRDVNPKSSTRWSSTLLATESPSQ